MMVTLLRMVVDGVIVKVVISDNDSGRVVTGGGEGHVQTI